MSAADYEITCTGFFADGAPTSNYLGSAYLLITPPGILLQHVSIVAMDDRVRVVFPRRGVLGARGGILNTPGGEPKTVRAASFPNNSDWIAFSDAALAAIDAAYPGQLLAAVSRRALSAAGDLSNTCVPASHTNESHHHAV